MLKMFGFRYWIVGAAIVVVAIFFMADKQHDAAKKYKSHRAEYCAALMATAEQKKACVEEGTSVKDYLPWRYILFIWPEGITTWAIIATGFVIAWQSSETRRAADAALGSAKAANDQIRMMKDKERARLSVKPIDKSTFTYDFLGENTVWLDIENFGTTHALNVRATCDAVPIANGIIPENVERGYLLVPLFQIPSEPTRDQSRR